MTLGWFLATLVTLLTLGAAPAQAVIFSENFDTVALGDINTTTPCGNNQPCLDLTAHGWNYVGANCTTYCSMTIVAAPFGRSGRVLRYRYDEDSDPLTVPAVDAHNASLNKYFSPTVYDLWGRFYLETDVNTNISTGATNSLWFAAGTKLHYIKPSGPSPSFVMGSAYPATPTGANASVYASQEMAVCPSGGIPVFKGGNGCNNNFQNTVAVVINDMQ